MNTMFKVLLLCTMIFSVHCIPMYLQPFDNPIIRSRRSPTQGVMFTGFYGHSQQDGFIPDGQVQDGCHGCGEEHGYPQEHGVHGDLPLPEHPHVPLHVNPAELPGTLHGTSDVPQLDEASTHEVTETAPHAPSADSDEDDDDDDSWPILKPGKGARPSFNFFPISFGGHGRSGGIPSGSTAIANSFSTGKRGVATSHATSYGDLSPALRNMHQNGGH